MSLLRKLFLWYLPGLVLAVIVLTAVVLWQLNMLSAQGLREASQFIADNSPLEVYRAVRGELDRDHGATDASYGQRSISGRGHTPWVLRTNLDQRPRMLSFALAPQTWAAYDTETGGLYQVWWGDIEFEGTLYDYRHGPQPRAVGEWWYRQSEPVRWVLDDDPQAVLTPRYLGHGFLNEGRDAYFELELWSGDERVARIREQPALVSRGEEDIVFQRQLRVSLNRGNTLSLLLTEGQPELSLAAGDNLIEIPIGPGAPIPEPELDIAGDSLEADISRGEQVVLNSDCVSCHNVTDQVVGPAYARIARKFRGRMQDNVIAALADSIVRGSVGTWGEVPMPAHPEMSAAEARLAAMYILSTASTEADYDVPLDAAGQAYSATRDYDIGPRLEAVHPSYSVENVLPEGFQPLVGGMDFRSDGKTGAQQLGPGRRGVPAGSGQPSRRRAAHRRWSPGTPGSQAGR